MLTITHYQNQGSRDYQEDRFGIFENFAGLSHLTLCLVCDGHGGFQVSDFLVKRYPVCLKQVFAEQKKLPKRAKFVKMMGMALERCIEEWDRKCFGDSYDMIKRIQKEGKKDAQAQIQAQFFAKIDKKKYVEAGCTAGSTFVAMLLDTNKMRAHVINIGDSRATWILNESIIQQTVDHNVKTKMQPIKGFHFTNTGGRLQDDLAMKNAVGDNVEELYGVVSREYSTAKIKLTTQDTTGGVLQQQPFRAVLASDGLFDIRSNQQILHEPYANATEIATRALAALVDQEEERQTLAGNSRWDKAKFKPMFEDNVTIIYILLSVIPAASSAQDDTKTKEQLSNNGAQQQTEILSQIEALRKNLDALILQKNTVAEAKTMTTTASSSSARGGQRKASRRRSSVKKEPQKQDVFKETHHGNVTMQFLRKPSKKKTT